MAASSPPSPLATLPWAALVGVLCGGASALFLALLEHATAFREAHEGIIYTLPVAGFAIGAIYERYGAAILPGNNLVIDALFATERERVSSPLANSLAFANGRAPAEVGPPSLATPLPAISLAFANGRAPAKVSPAPIPLRLAPMVLVATVLTHLFGGSAGREGTAVQMGGALADAVAARVPRQVGLRHALVSAGVAGGFGSVFGTPLAGAIFAMEFVVIGRPNYASIAATLLAAYAGDFTARALGTTHSSYPQAPSVVMSPLLLAKWVLFAGLVALTTIAFIEFLHLVKKHATRLLPRLPLRMAAGGVAIVLLWKLSGTSEFLGLGVPTILRAFHDPNLASYTFIAKLVATAVTLGAGFQGGEVTPLFFVGAALGNLCAPLLGVPTELAAGVGLAAVFAAASNSPIALTVMAVELLGGAVLPHALVVCVVAFLLTGSRSIYPAQRIGRLKSGARLARITALRDL